MNETNETALLLKCYEHDKLLLMTNMEKRINQLLFPIQFLVAVTGNLLTMSVLLSAHMKNRANHLLAFLALCDILVFVMMFPHYLCALDVFAESHQFRKIFFKIKVQQGALSNWFSAAAIWFVLAVSVERLLIIKFPFRSLDNYNSRQVWSVSICILVGTFILTSYHHVSHTCRTYIRCNGTQIFANFFDNSLKSWGKHGLNPHSTLTIRWIGASIYLNAAFAVLLPVFAVAILNISLVRLLRKRNTQELLVHSVNCNPTALQEQERKMTHTVLAIITCFSLTQGPSAIVYLFQVRGPSSSLQIASVVANQLVLTGKMLNVVLFCMTSSTFRRKLLQTCRRWIYTALYCSRKGGNRYRFSRSQSKSLVTQKTSLVYSPSSKGMGSIVVSEMYSKKPSAATFSPLVANTEETVQ